MIHITCVGMEMGQYAIIRGELHCAHLFCYVAQQAKLGPGRLTVEVSRSHTIIHTHIPSRTPLYE